VIRTTTIACCREVDASGDSGPCVAIEVRLPPAGATRIGGYGGQPIVRCDVHNRPIVSAPKLALEVVERAR
jgi:hypothetical protein